MKNFLIIITAMLIGIILFSCKDGLIFRGQIPDEVEVPDDNPSIDYDPSVYDEPLCHYSDGDIVSSIPFNARQDGYNYFRIPAVCASKEGTLLAFCEARNTQPDFMNDKNASSFPVNPAIMGSSKDIGDIDLVLKRSIDGGTTWESMITILDDYTNTCGNPAPVVDFKTGRIWLFFCWQPYPASSYKSDIVASANDGNGTRRVLYCYSDDDGKTWSRPVDATARLKKPFTSHWFATGPGHAIQLKVGDNRGRMIVPCNYRTGVNSAAGGNYSACIYSDDNGETWNVGGEAGLGGNESIITELANGDLYTSMRIATVDLPTTFRGYNVSSDGGISWEELTLSPDLRDPGCQGSVCSIKREGMPTNTLLLTNCLSSSRSSLTISKSTDGGRKWNSAYVVHSSRAAYSDIIQLTDGSICVLYECGDGSIPDASPNPNERISFLRIPKSKVGTLLGI